MKETDRLARDIRALAPLGDSTALTLTVAAYIAETERELERRLNSRRARAVRWSLNLWPNRVLALPAWNWLTHRVRRLGRAVAPLLAAVLTAVRR